MLGYAAFPKRINDGIFQGIQQKLYMHGTEWVSAIVCPEKPRKFANIDILSWSIVYFREDSFSIPNSWFDDLIQPVNIFGDIIPSPMGTRPCFVKARAAAIILGMNSISHRRI